MNPCRRLLGIITVLSLIQFRFNENLKNELQPHQIGSVHPYHAETARCRTLGILHTPTRFVCKETFHATFLKSPSSCPVSSRHYVDENRVAHEMLAKVAAEVAAPMERIGNISIIGGGQGGTTSPVADNVPIVMAKTFQTIKETTGVDLAEIMRGETYDAKVTKNVNVSGVDSDSAKAAVIANAIADAVHTKTKKSDEK